MEGLPLIPGYIFHDPRVREHRVGHKLDFLNGFRVVRDSRVGIGGRPIDAASGRYIDNEDHERYDPALTYGRRKREVYQQFLPHYVLYDNKCLAFQAFFRQGIANSPNEHFTVRHVNILYFLEDDTISVIEPRVCNAGLWQGKLLQRSKIEKSENGDYYSWKDFNVGIDVCKCVTLVIISSTLLERLIAVYHNTEFLSSQGIDVNEKEVPPMDEYTLSRRAIKKIATRTTPVVDDARRKFLEFDKMVLSFDASFDKDQFQILYFLMDDTIAIREVHKPNDGKDPVALLLKRTKVPKDWRNVPSNYPSICLERGDSEIVEYFTPKDLKVGETVSIFGRKFFLHDCDAFTRKYYSDMLCITQPERVPRPEKKPESLDSQSTPLPPHTGFGTPEDSYASCLSFMPKVPKKDVVRQLFNFPKRMRYSMEMDAVYPEDKDRDFVLEYNLSDGTIVINEIPKRNSGRREGCFLSSRLVPKPGSSRENPSYYTPQDFFIGAKINVFNHYFLITGADLFVYRYIEANPEKFPQDLRDNIRNYFLQQGCLQDDIDARAEKIQEELDTNKDLDPSIGVPYKNEFDIEPCIKECQERSKSAYIDINGQLEPIEPPGELCSDPPVKSIIATVEPEEPVEKSKETDRKYLSKKQLKWFDEIQNEFVEQHPTTSYNPDYPDYKEMKHECKEPHYFAFRDGRPEVDQVMYEKN